MTRAVRLSVNDAPISLDYFIQGFIDHTAGGIVASLEGGGEIISLELSIDEARQVTLNVNNASIPLNPFVQEVIKNTLMGLVSSLKGVSEINKLAISITR